MTAKDETRDSLERQRLNLMLSSLLERRREEMGVSFDPSFVENFEIAGGAT